MTTHHLLEGLLRLALLFSAAVVLVALLRPLLLKRLGAGAAYAAWLLVPALLLTPALPRPQPVQEPLPRVMQAVGLPLPPALPALDTTPAAPGHGAPWLALWLSGTALSLALQCRRQWRLQRLGARLPAGHSPALVGVIRPRLRLPVDFEQRFSPVERTLILQHVDVHRRRGDNAWNLLAGLLLALQWFNPLAHWAWRRLRADQELACDAAVLATQPQATPDYTRALLLAHGLHAHAAPLASHWRSTHPLVERIAMLKHPRISTPRRRGLLAGALLTVTALTYAAQAADAPAPGEYDPATLEVRWQDKQGGTQARWTVQLPWHFFVTNKPLELPARDSGGTVDVTLQGSRAPDGHRQIEVSLRDRQTLAPLPTTQWLSSRAGSDAQARVSQGPQGGEVVVRFMAP
ncbi:M56 family metallopeptidase [Roseateles asaccharophilus]|uniref:Beta-lactamase regulating signal transducer with metallopeptidase domain n=1 Tax=Roseateles asaccharophilus TaxID=582607 RepID=A0ABU2A287_9BURK|nr:M56 family metallopeptidase [Roseateles asaccharophilus]MDR7331313.1 beta-lactamase regulating signal transducer with metallopeptidase domain [Roseateles asaccharophilus]